MMIRMSSVFLSGAEALCLEAAGCWGGFRACCLSGPLSLTHKGCTMLTCTPRSRYAGEACRRQGGRSTWQPYLALHANEWWSACLPGLSVGLHGLLV